MGKAPARHAHVLAFSSFAKEHTINAVPVAAQEFISAATSNSSAVHKLESAKHIPLLCQQVLNQSLSFLFALFICHASSPHVFINETRKPGRKGYAPMDSAPNGSQTPHLRSIEINTSASSALEEAYEHKITRTPTR